MIKLYLILAGQIVSTLSIKDTSTENINDIVKDENYVLEDILEDCGEIWAIVS